MSLEKDPVYIAIDLKSFYAAVECVERCLDPLTTHLVVADSSRTDKTICLAVSPSLKALGISGRPRLFEVKRHLNALQTRDGKPIEYITAVPRMRLYMEYSSRIYGIYLNYVAPEDIHVYSIDEVFIDVTHYLHLYKNSDGSVMTPRQLAARMIKDVLSQTGITAAAGIGTNLYLAKIALDIVAKHVPEDENGARVASLTEQSYRKYLWTHEPLTDFWRVGKGYAKKLHEIGLYTMGDIARCSIGKTTDYYNEDLLYRLFGVNAELLIDHAWGWEPCTIRDIKAYRPDSRSIGSGQVLPRPYTADKARLVVQEMTDLLTLELVDNHLVTNQVALTIGYDIENLSDPRRRKDYDGAITTDHYGRSIPKHAHGTGNLDQYTSSTRRLIDRVLGLYDQIVNRDLLIRRITLAFNHVQDGASETVRAVYEQLTLFGPPDDASQDIQNEKAELEREKKLQRTMLDIKKKYGKNAILKGMNLEDGATARERNAQIGGHKA